MPSLKRIFYIFLLFIVTIYIICRLLVYFVQPVSVEIHKEIPLPLQEEVNKNIFE